MKRLTRMWQAIVLSGLIALAPMARNAFGRGFPISADVLQPRTVLSASGEYALTIDPEDPFGRSGAFYRLTRRGIGVWSGERPYTLWDAFVADDGAVAGCAYSFGKNGVPAGGRDKGHGDFRVILMDGTGEVKLSDVTIRKRAQFDWYPANPVSLGIFIDRNNDRLVVRVADEDVNRLAEEWWCYEISTGKKRPVFRPDQSVFEPQPVRSIIDAKPLARTKLTLIHWYLNESRPGGRSGAGFTLADPAGKTVWTLDWPDDYTVANDEEAELRRWNELHEHGAILRIDERAKFDLWRAKSGERVSFSVHRDLAGEWFVGERGREPYVGAVKVERAPEPIGEWHPRVLGRITLRLPAQLQTPPIRDIDDFVFDGCGRIAFIRREIDEGPTLVVVEPSGKIVHSLPLSVAKAGTHIGHFAWIDGDRFVAGFGSATDPELTKDFHTIDLASGQLQRIDSRFYSSGSKVAVFRDGLLATLGVYGSELSTYDRQGVRRWSVQAQDKHKDPTALVSAVDIAITSDARIAVLDRSRELVQLFDRDGKHVKTVDLKKAWNYETNYVTEIKADVDGGFVVRDYGGRALLIRMRADGAVRARLNPRYPNGRKVDLRVGARVAPDGRLWISDGDALLRLDETGVVDRILGDPPQSDRLDSADGLTVDSKGRILAVAGRTGTVHVFDPDGRWLFACRPDPRDIEARLHRAQVIVSDSGEIFLPASNSDNRKFVHFSADGRRLGLESLPDTLDRASWYAQPGTSRRWVLSYREVMLVETTGEVIRTIARRVDRMWLESIGAAATAQDGSIAVVAHAETLPGKPWTVNLYSAAGETIGMIDLPGLIKWNYPLIAYDGRHVVLVQGDQIVCLDVAGNVIGKLTPLPAGKDKTTWTPFLTSSGRELNLFDGGIRIYRFAMP